MKAMMILLLMGSMFFGSVSSLQHPDADWRNKIILFQSTRADVEKLLGKPVGQYYGVTYKLKDGILYLTYYDFDHCQARYGYDAEWNLPEWTVIEIEYMPDHPPKLASLHLDLKKFRTEHDSPDVPELVSYINDEEGVDYTFEGNGELNSVRYFPGSRYDKFRCPKL